MDGMVLAGGFNVANRSCDCFSLTTIINFLIVDLIIDLLVAVVGLLIARRHSHHGDIGSHEAPPPRYSSVPLMKDDVVIHDDDDDDDIDLLIARYD